MKRNDLCVPKLAKNVQHAYVLCIRHVDCNNIFIQGKQYSSKCRGICKCVHLIFYHVNLGTGTQSACWVLDHRLAQHTSVAMQYNVVGECNVCVDYAGELLLKPICN